MNKVTQWACFQEVAKVIGEEAAKFELEKVKLLHLEKGNELYLVADQSLLSAFRWRHSPQGEDFWNDLNEGNLPDAYKQKPTDEAVVKPIKETFNASVNQDSITSLVEDLYIRMNPWVNKNHTLKIDADILSVFDLEGNLCDQVSTIELLLVAVNKLLDREDLNERL